MVKLIKKAAEGKIDYRGVLRMFRSSILTQKRRLTRMRPSHRVHSGHHLSEEGAKVIIDYLTEVV